MNDLELPLIARIRECAGSTALRTGHKNHDYGELDNHSSRLASELLALAQQNDLKEIRLALLLPAGFDFVQALLAIWRAGGVAVPLSLAAQKSELEHVLVDSGIRYLLVSEELAAGVSKLSAKLGIKLIRVKCDNSSVFIEPDWKPFSSKEACLPVISPQRRAIILYTSGTTSKPKGVVLNHACVQARIEVLVTAWAWQPKDCIPLFLPLHHIHGLFNVLLCGLWAGATVEPYLNFTLETLLTRVAAGNYSLFMAVPTIYIKLIRHLELLPEKERESILAGFRGMRLMVSGSSALPETRYHQWLALTGQALLERYGMTETGMAIANPLQGERHPGVVGQPMPSVEVRLISEQGEVLQGEGLSGEIQIAGPSVFQEYWNRPDIMADAFQGKWFNTGDMAQIEQGYYRILGRYSTDIINTAGFKVSALEIEALLLESPLVDECAVVSLPDQVYGEIIGVAVVSLDASSWDQEKVERLCRTKLSSYKCPRCWLLLNQLPRNAMGKVIKPKVQALFHERKMK